MVLEGVEPGAVGADPEDAVAVLAKGPDDVPRHALGPAPDREGARGEPPQAVVGADPEAPVAILREGRDDLLREPTLDVERGIPAPGDAGDSAPGSDLPDGLGGPGQINVGHNHAGAFRGERERTRPPNAVAGPGNDGRVPLQSHTCALFPFAIVLNFRL